MVALFNKNQECGNLCSIIRDLRKRGFLGVGNGEIEEFGGRNEVERWGGLKLSLQIIEDESMGGRRNNSKRLF